MSKVAVLVLGVLLWAGDSQGGEIWQEISVPAAPEAIAELARAGADLEGMTERDGRYHLFAESAQVGRWRAAGMRFEVEDADVAATNRLRLAAAAPASGGFANGSMSGYFTNAEVHSRIAGYRKLNPAIMTSKIRLGTSIEGRPLFAYKISDNATKDEDEPEVLFTALTHAREPQGMMSLVYFMKYLVENYGVDPDVTYLVNNREIWCVPVVNPDGYIYNQTIDPQGGGMWRKNKRANTDSSIGVDLNRNFGHEWGRDNDGSSPFPSDETYRGTGPFSEPETAALKKFFESRKFAAAINFHTYGNMLIHPWGYADEVPESVNMTRLAYRLARGTELTRIGNAMATVRYTSNGDSDDWMYVKGAYAMTPEVGSSDFNGGFWPIPERIEPTAQSTLPMCMATTTAAGSFATIETTTLADKSRDGKLGKGESAQLKIKFANFGVGGSTSELQIRIAPRSGETRVQVVKGGTFKLPVMAAWGTKLKTLSLKATSFTDAATACYVDVEYSEAGVVIRRESVVIALAGSTGEGTVLLQQENRE